jgi:CheY-like chemotaxis protein
MKTVLIIDDDAQSRKLMCEILKPDGWQVLEAEDGESGIDLARKHHPQVVLCDLLMPRYNGFQVCRTLRADKAMRSMRIVVTTGRDFKSDRHAAFEAGADEYLTKPIAPQQLMAVISRLTNSTGHANKKPAPSVSLPPAPARFKFWGVRGSIPAPGPGTIQFGGNTSCIEVRAGGEIIILDAGTGLRLLGLSLLNEFKDQPLNMTLLLTHTHWDHIQGFPFFSPIWCPQNRLRILGYEGARNGLANVLSAQMESPYFPVALGELPGNIEIEELRDMSFKIGSVRVEAFFANHPGTCVGYRIFTDDGSVAFFPDNEPHYQHRRAGVESSFSNRVSLEFARTEDDKMAEFLHGADVLVMDSQYDHDEYPQHVGWGHGCVDDVVALAIRAQVKKLFLFHHDPDHDDAKINQMVERARQIAAKAGSTLQVEGAREGLVVELAAVSRGAAKV